MLIKTTTKKKIGLHVNRYIAFKNIPLKYHKKHVSNVLHYASNVLSHASNIQTHVNSVVYH